MTVVSGSAPAAETLSAPSRTALTRRILLSFLLVLAVYAASGVSDFGDGFLAMPTAHSLVYDGDLDLSEFADEAWYGRHYGQVEVDGRQVDYFPWLTSAVAVPSIVAWDTLSAVGLTTNSRDVIGSSRMRAFQILTASTIAAAAAVLLALVTRRLFALDAAPADRSWLPADHPWAIPVFAAVIGLGTTLWSTASRALWQHGPSVLLCSAALLCVLHLLGGERLAPARHPAVLAAAAGALAGLSYWIRPTNLVLCATLLLLLILRRRDALAPFGLGLVAAQAAMVAANLSLLGRAQPPYFAASRIGWHADLPQAVAANLVSPARGLVVFSPFLVAVALLLRRRRLDSLGADLRAVVVAAALGSAGYLLAVSAYGEKWWAGHSFGPRFMTESLVLLAPLALLAIFGPRATDDRVRTRSFRQVSALLIGVAVVVHLGSAQFAEVRCWNRTPVDIDEDPSRVWDLARPQVAEGVRQVLGREELTDSDEACAA